MEASNTMLEKATEKSLRDFMIKHLQASHLLFANDTQIFYDTNVKQFKNLHHLLLCFEAVFVFKINLEKSEAITVEEINNV